jgi:PPK2 family polyphosphate:nucleotide phosphotransferase
MKLAEFVKEARKRARPYRVSDGKGFRLKHCDPADTGELSESDRPRIEALHTRGVQALSELQSMLYAQDRWALLLIFQAMDAAGKDGVIEHVMSGVNPQGCQVASFKEPSNEELDHDFLWRSNVRLPERGRIGIFNRSYYEEVLVVRVHPEILSAQKLPRELVTKHIWQHRFRDIRAYERYLSANGVVIRKFFLNVSRAEQKRRFLERIAEPEKNWKFAASDVRERDYWKDYMHAYEEMIRATATEDAPWYVVPADHKWYTRAVVAATVIETLGGLGLSYPKVSKKEGAELRAAARQLEAEG